MQGVKQLSELRDRLELIMSIPSGNSYVDSASELDDVNDGYEATAYHYDWPSLLDRAGIVKVANLDRYSLPSNFRKARYVKLDGNELKETELQFLKKSRQSYTIDLIQEDIIIRPIPTAASDAYTLSNAESAGNAVTVELNTVSGLSQLDEIFIDSVSGTDEFSIVSSVGSGSIVTRLDAAKSASDILYRVNDIIDILFYKRITLLSAAGDKTLLPPALDYVLLEFSAYKAYSRLEMFDEADRQYKLWLEGMARVFNAFDKVATGQSNEFSV